jgi:hypothetical protein
MVSTAASQQFHASRPYLKKITSEIINHNSPSFRYNSPVLKFCWERFVIVAPLLWRMLMDFDGLLMVDASRLPPVPYRAHVEIRRRISSTLFSSTFFIITTTPIPTIAIIPAI